MNRKRIISLIDCVLRKKVEPRLVRAIELLSHRYSQEIVETPLDRASASFAPDSDMDADRSPHGMLRLAAAFVQHIFRFGTRIRRELTNEQAETEVLAMLQHYSGPSCRGPEALCIEYADLGEVGPKYVCQFLLNSVKSFEISNHRRRVIEELLESMSWQEKITAVACIAERRGSVGFEELREQPERFALNLPRLVLDYVEWKDELEHVFSGR